MSPPHRQASKHTQTPTSVCHKSCMVDALAELTISVYKPSKMQDRRQSEPQLPAKTRPTLQTHTEQAAGWKRLLSPHRQATADVAAAAALLLPYQFAAEQPVLLVHALAWQPQLLPPHCPCHCFTATCCCLADKNGNRVLDPNRLFCCCLSCSSRRCCHWCC
jgi:hypothetical protein